MKKKNEKKISNEINNILEFISIKELPFLIATNELDPGNAITRVPGDYGVMNYEKANDLVSKIGDGARLPNNDELKLIHEHRKKIPNLSIGDSYWSCENSTETDFVYGKKGTAYSMTLYSGLFLKGGRGARNQCLVRLVKDKS